MKLKINNLSAHSDTDEPLARMEINKNKINIRGDKL